MPMSPARRALWLASLALSPALAACAGGEDKDSGGIVEAVGPSLEHTVGEGQLTQGDGLPITVTARDPDGVREVSLSFRTVGSTYWDTVVLEKGEAGAWSGTIPAVFSPGVEYAFSATDGQGAEARLPDNRELDPFRRQVLPAAQALPFLEGFEIEEGRNSLFLKGWQTPSEGFSAYPFTMASGRAAEGSIAAFHSRGAAESDPMIDWLISPPLDFTTLELIQVTWQEAGGALENAGTHGLYISTTTSDPSAFTPVAAELPLPTGGAFSRSALYDLSAYAGNPTVYLGWRYEGQNADDWYIDDVQVKQLGAELEPSFSSSPSEVQPGDTLTLRWDLTNSSPAAAIGWEAYVELPEGGGVVTPELQAIPDVASGETVGIEFSLTLDPDQPTNRYLPVILHITDGERSWVTDDDLLIGQGSTAVIDFSLDASGGALVQLGVGDPNAPDLLLDVYAGALGAGPQSFTVDITEHEALLPPEPGPGRWFAKVDVTATGTFTAFSLDAAGALFTAGPAALSGGAQVLQVPPPPVPRLVSASPAVGAPGDLGLPLVLQLVNDGAPTSGPVSLDVVSLEPTGTIHLGETLLIDPDRWEAGEPLVVTGPTLDISAAHADSQPLALRLDLDDGLESWSLPMSVAVPWPVLRVTGIDVRDSGGDGVLNPGESATIDVSMTNVGDLPTVGRATGIATLSGAATATLLDDEDSISPLGVGATALMSYRISGVSGAPGDALNLEIALTDDRNTYAALAPLVLGEPPWQSLSTRDDPAGDYLGASGNDLARGEVRFYEGELQLRMTAHAPIDETTLFVEAWATSPGARYIYYRVVLQGGTLRVQGYDGGWTTLTTGTVLRPSDEVVEFHWPVADLGFVLNSLSIGFAAGWCGPPTYYCDQYPDGWGYPYDSFSTADWFELRW